MGLTKERIESFLNDLQAITEKHGISVGSYLGTPILYNEPKIGELVYGAEFDDEDIVSFDFQKVEDFEKDCVFKSEYVLANKGDRDALVRDEKKIGGDFNSWWEEWGDIVKGWDSYSIAVTAYGSGVEDS